MLFADDQDLVRTRVPALTIFERDEQVFRASVRRLGEAGSVEELPSGAFECVFKRASTS